MTEIQLVNFLTKNRGYLKKGTQLVADKFGVSYSVAKSAMITAKNGKGIPIVYERAIAAPIIQNKPTKNNSKDIVGTYWVTGCAHAPWQNKAMYNSTFKYLEKEVDLTGLILAGDIIDLNSLSSHDRGKVSIKGVTLDWEYKEASKFLDEIDQITKKVKSKDFLYGNHEDRYLRSMKDVDTAKYGDALLSPEEGLKLTQRGYNIYNNWKDSSIQLGKHLDICHGEFLNVHSAKKTIDTYRKSTLYFHTHRFQVYMEGLVAGWNMGCGADINAPIFGYATRAMKTSWVNSSCLVTLDSEGLYHVEPLLFIGNKLIVNGKCY
jgi:hypothetical protein